MKRSIVFIAWLLALVLLAACTDSILPSQTPSVTVSPTATASPAPVPSAITRTDIPAYFLPGLSAAGAIPVQAYRIGVIVGNNFKDTVLRSEFERLCEQYEESFGLEIAFELSITEASQQSVVKSLVSSGVDFMIFSAGGDASTLGALCDAAGVPYLTMDCRAGTPGEGSYVCSIERDDYLIGVLTGLSIANTLTEANGKAAGNIGEIVGDVSDEASILRSAGLRRALASYPDIQVVCSVTTADDTTYHAAVNVMKAYRQGELDGIVVPDDTAAVEALQAVVNYGRDELRGRIWSVGATRDGLTGVWYGEFAQTVEATAQTGMMALEYAVQYLNGDGGDIPAVVCSVTRVFSAGSQGQKDAIALLIAQMEESGYLYCMDNQGAYDLFLPDGRLAQLYPQHYYEYADIAAYLAEFEPYTTQEAVYETAAAG